MASFPGFLLRDPLAGSTAPQASRLRRDRSWTAEAALKALLAILLGLIVVPAGLTALVLATATVNGRVLASAAETAAGMVLSRDVQLGRIRVLDWGMPARFELTNLALGNPEWAEQPWLARAERIEAAVEITGIFPPEVQVPRLEVQAPAAFLEVNGNGRANWQGLLSAGQQPQSQTSAPLYGLQELLVVDGSLTYCDAMLDAVQMVRLEGLRVAAPSANEPVSFEGEGRIEAGQQPLQSFSFSGHTGTLDELRQGDVPVEAQALTGPVQARMSGRIQDLFQTPSASFDLLVDGKDLKPLLSLAGLSIRSTPPFHAAAQITTGPQQWRAENLQARLGESELTGALTLDRSGPKPMVSGKLVAITLAADQLRGLNIGNGGGGQGNGPQDLPFHWLEAVNAELMLRAERILGSALPLQAASASIRLAKGVLRIDPMRVETDQGNLTGTMEVDATAIPPAIQLTATAQSLPVELLPIRMQALDGQMQGNADVRSKGQSMAALLANLAGSFQGSVDGQLGEEPLTLTLSAERDADADSMPVKLNGEVGATPVQASADLQLEAQRVAARNLQARFGETQMNGTASADFQGPVPMVRADLSIPRLAWSPLQKAIPASGGGSGEAGDQQLIPPAPIPFETLKAANADVTVDIAEVTGLGFPVGGGQFEARLKDGRLQVDPFTVAVAEGRVKGSFTADAQETPPTVGLKADLDAVSMKAALAALPIPGEVQGLMHGTVDLTSAGPTLQMVSETLGGSMRFYVTDGKFTTRLIDAMAVNIGEALGFLFSGGEARPIDCVVGSFDIVNGTIDPETMVFVTPEMVVRGKGQVNLAKETMDVRIVPRPKNRKLLDMTVPVDATGPLTNPNIDVNASLWTKLAEERVCERTLAGQTDETATR
ncbi:AsmA family protein [Indioceanicola profundi]|uniref:AsmA family protein n=1 Tax=Indioceanicola profundi TaxID=2220096 RepID=UPI0013C3F2BF|nr:AsmA family protein [Indioceanicola profundi]